MRVWLVISLFLLTCSVKAQDHHVVDSLRSVIEKAVHDTSVCDAYLNWGEQVYLNNPDTAGILFHRARETAEAGLASSPPTALEKKYLASLADALSNIGFIYNSQGDIPKALEYFHKGLKVYEETRLPDGQLGHKKRIASSLNNIGLAYYNQGDIPNALKYWYKSLKVHEETRLSNGQVADKKGMATSLGNIGGIYISQGDTPKALEYFHKSLKIQEETDDKYGMAYSLNNIGAVYYHKGDTLKALEYYHKSLKIREEIGDKSGIATSLNNIGAIYDMQGDIPKALEYFHKSVKVAEDLGNKESIAISLNNIGLIELDKGALTNALNYGIQGLDIAKEIGSPNLLAESSRLLSKVARKQGNFQEALEMYELHILMRDSVKNEATQKATIRQQTKYEFEKAQLVKEQEEKEVARALSEKTSRRDNLQYSVILIVLLVIGILLAVIGRFSIPIKVAEGLIFFSFLIFFEFILVLADPYIETWSSGAPGIKLLFNAGIAALIFPLHALFETKLKGRLAKSEA